MAQEVKIRNSFLSGFGAALGCLVAIVVFFVGGCLLTFGSCAAVVGTAVSSIPKHTELVTTSPTNTQPEVSQSPTPSHREELYSPTFKFETISLWDNGPTTHRETIYVERPTKVDIARHALSVKGDGDRWMQIHYYNDRSAAPRLQIGSAAYYPDESYKFLLAIYIFNPHTHFEQLSFGEEVPTGDAVTGEAGELVRMSHTLPKPDDVEDAQTDSSSTKTPTYEVEPIQSIKELDEQARRDVDAKHAELAKNEEAKYRTWTSAKGTFSTEAKIVSIGNGIVTLLKRDGKSIKVPQELLSDADREFIAKWRREKK